MLKPIDVFVVVKLAVSTEAATYADLAFELGLSASQVHRAVKNSQASGLIHSGTLQTNSPALLEFLVHGVKYAYPPKRGPVTRGMATAHSAPPLRSVFVDNGSAFVWPDPEGEMRGESLEPLHKRVPFAAKRDPRLHEMLALIDAVRAGRARDRELAQRHLEERVYARAL
ncbi:MAG: hypothetical protein ACI80V_001988 [Rhodothermales bacterium]|jgi:hypothetical protein